MQFNDIYIFLNSNSSTPTEDQLTQAQSLIVNLERKSVNTIIEKEDNSELQQLLSTLQKDDLVVAFEAATLASTIQDLQKIVLNISSIGAHLIIANLGLSSLAFTTSKQSNSEISTKGAKAGRHLSHTKEEFEYYFNQVQSKEKSVTDICKEMKISRNTFYELKKRYVNNQDSNSSVATEDSFNILREKIKLPDLPEELKLNEELVPVRQDNLIEESCVQESLHLNVEDNSEPVSSVSTEDDDTFSEDEYNDIINTIDADNYTESNAAIDEYDYISTVPTDEDNESYMSKVESTTIDSDDDFDLSDFTSSIQQQQQDHNCDFSIVNENEQVILADSEDRSRDYDSDEGKQRRSWFSIFR